MLKVGIVAQTGELEPDGAVAVKAPLPPSPKPEELAPNFPQLEILECLGRGGMGAVYKARQPKLDRFVALKILMRDREKRASDTAFGERFLREARALARLNHPNIVTVHDFGESAGYQFLLMEYVDGLSLRQLLQSRQLAPAEALGIVAKICDALQYAHEQGVVHRDIKPENILLDKEGRVKIADFGIAKISGQLASAGLTQERQVIGTPQYMAPEQIEKPLEVDHRADIYSLGVVFYEMLTGELPLGKFQSPSQKTPMDARLDGVVLHALEKEPALRYQTASEVRTDLETIAATPPAIPAPAPQNIPPHPAAAALPSGMSNGWKIAAALGVLGLAVLIVFLCFGGWFIGPKKKIAPDATASLVVSNASWNLLNENQRRFALWEEEVFRTYFDMRTFDTWSSQERADLERRSLDTLKAPRSAEYYQAMNTLVALRSTNALPALRAKAFARNPNMLHSEISNRGRWMAVRALGLIGDKSAVPELIHALYYYETRTRWWAQISLVELTGQNFGGDWQGWGNWWNSQNGQPPFNPEMVHWWSAQPGPEALAEKLAESDRKFFQFISKKLKPTEPAQQTP